MKKSLLFIFLFLTLSLGLVSAVDVEVKDSVKKGENFIVKVTGKFFKPLSKNNIEFHRGNANVPFGIVSLEKIEGSLYFYLNIPETTSAGNYTMTFVDAEYYSGTSIIKEDIVTEFTILEETVPFTISPPLVISEDKYVVTVQNLLPTSIDINLEKEEKVISVEGEEVVEDSPGFFDLLFGVEEEVVVENITEEQKEVEYLTLMSGESKELEYLAPVYIGFETLNLYYEDLGYGVLVYNPSGRIIEEEPVEEEKEIIVINQTTGEEEVLVNETVNETEAENEDEIINETPEDINKVESCVAQGGIICTPKKEKCAIKEVESSDGECCLAECKAIPESSNGKIIGWTIIGIIALFLTWFFKKKYKKAAPGKVDLIKSSKPKRI